MAQITSPVFLLIEQHLGKSYKMCALLTFSETAFPNFYAALSLCCLLELNIVFAEKCIIRLHMLIRFLKIAIIDFLCRGSVCIGCSSMHVQNVYTCLPGTSYDKTYAHDKNSTEVDVAPALGKIT